MYNKVELDKYRSSKFKFGKAVLRRDLTVLNATEAFYEFLGKGSRMFFTQLIHPDYVGEFVEACTAVKTGEQYRVITLLRNKNNLYQPVDIYITLSEPLEGGEQLIKMDIYEIMAVEKDYIDSQQKLDKYRTIMCLADLVYMEYWPDTGRIILFNYHMRKSHRLYENHIDAWKEDALRYALNTDSNLAEIELLYNHLKGLTNRFYSVIKSGFLNSSHIHETLEIQGQYIGRHNMEVMECIVKRKDIKDDDIPYYLTQAGRDSATGLLNKRAITEYTNDVLAALESTKYYMILIDIDDFKRINDNFGHLMGDRAVVVLSETLIEVLGDRGIVGRFGGDEFFILTERIYNEEQLRVFLKALISKVKVEQENKLGDVRFTLSIGISQYPEHGSNFNSLFAVADKALYLAKEKGKNRYIIYRSHMHDSYNMPALQGGLTISAKQAVVTRKIVRALVSQGRGILEEALSWALAPFDLGAITVHSGDGRECYLQLGTSPKELNEISYVYSPEYSFVAVDDSTNVLANIDNIAKFGGRPFEVLDKANCGAFVQFALPNMHEAECIITFWVFNRAHKWNETETINLEIIANVVYSLWKKTKKEAQ